jgi:hypothetical protein
MIEGRYDITGLAILTEHWSDVRKCTEVAQAQKWVGYYATGRTSEESGFDSRQRQQIYLVFTVFRLVLGPTQPLVYWGKMALSAGAKGPERGCNH